MVLVLTWLSIVPLLLSIIPVVAIIPILLYIGALIGAQAFQATPKSHAPAIILALVPNLAAWAKVQIDGALGAAGTNAAKVGFDKMAQNGVLYDGLAVLAGGAVVTGLLWGAMVVFLIDRKPSAAGVAAITAIAEHDPGREARHQIADAKLHPAQRHTHREQQMTAAEHAFFAHI